MSDIPPVTDEAGGHIFTKGQGGISFNGNAVAIVYPTQIGKFEMARKRRSLPSYPFHHAPIPA